MSNIYERNYAPYRSRRGADVYVKDEEKSKKAAYEELEDLAIEMLKIMDSNDINIFEYGVRSPQRQRAFTLIANSESLSEENSNE